jgi:hypothetical protein
MMARIVVSAVNALSRSVRFTVFPAVAAVATEVRSWRASCSRMGWKECVHAAGTNLRLAKSNKTVQLVFDFNYI